MIMPYSAGGPGDTLTRLVAQSMTKTLKQQVLVENVAGAGGTIGSTRVANASPDGYTLLMIHVSHATNPALYPKLRYDPIKDFEPVGLVADLPMVFVAKKDFPPNDFKGMVEYVKANKDKVNYGHAGIGSASHLCGLLFFSAIQTNVTTVPFKGAGPAMNDLLGGQIDFMCDQTLNVVSPLKAQKIKGYAVASKARSPALPNLPTANESGLPGFELNIWYGLFAPKGTPKPVLDKLVAGLQEAVKDPTVKSRFADLGATAVTADRAQPQALRILLKSEIDKWGPVIKKAGVYGE
jgi:tripartite-type tricarboxylate transporter receptor subunit TctC